MEKRTVPSAQTTLGFNHIDTEYPFQAPGKPFFKMQEANDFRPSNHRYLDDFRMDIDPMVERHSSTNSQSSLCGELESPGFRRDEMPARMTSQSSWRRSAWVMRELRSVAEMLQRLSETCVSEPLLLLLLLFVFDDEEEDLTAVVAEMCCCSGTRSR